MVIKGLMDECFSDYKKPAMYIATPYCSFKCDKDNGCAVCQNSKLAHQPNIEVSVDELIERYLANPITKAIVFSGLEPFDSMDDVELFIKTLRDKYKCDDDVVIYTGYTIDEVSLDDSGRMENATYNWLRHYKNIYVKFGRYLIGQEPHYDEVLGVKLASDNQYGKKVSYERV